jgi:hypothetical protein
LCAIVVTNTAGIGLLFSINLVNASRLIPDFTLVGLNNIDASNLSAIRSQSSASTNPLILTGKVPSSTMNASTLARAPSSPTSYTK